MDATFDIRQRTNEIAAGMAKQWLDRRRSNPDSVGQSPDGLVTVTLNGLGDVTEVRIRPDELPQGVAERIAGAFTAAWRSAARAAAQSNMERGPLASQPGIAEIVREEIGERYGPPAESPAPPATPRPAPGGAQEDDDFFGAPIMRRQ